MQVAARQYLATGVVLVASGAIVMSPISPPGSTVQVPAIAQAEVSLAAAPSPLEVYSKLLTNTLTNLQAIGETELAAPAPIVRQIVANQVNSGKVIASGFEGISVAMQGLLDPENPTGIPAFLQRAVDEFSQGNINGGVSDLWSAFLFTAMGAGLPLMDPIITVLGQPVKNLNNLFSDATWAVLPAMGLLNVMYPTLIESGNVGQELLDSAKAGDVLNVANTLLGAPGRVTDALLNGTHLNGGGILGPSASLGFAGTLRDARDYVASLIAPPSDTSEITSVPDASAKMVTLKDESVVVSDDAKAELAANVAAVQDDSSGESAKDGAVSKRSGAVKQVREGVQSAVKNVTDSLKKVTGEPPRV